MLISSSKKRNEDETPLRFGLTRKGLMTMIIVSRHENSINEYPCLLDTCQGALSRHFWAQTIQKYFFLTFTRAEIIV